MYKITFFSYRCIHLCRVVFEVYIFFLFFIKTLFPGGLLPTFPIISISPFLLLPPSPFPSSLFGGGGGGEEREEGRRGAGAHLLIPHRPTKWDNEK